MSMWVTSAMLTGVPVVTEWNRMDDGPELFQRGAHAIAVTNESAQLTGLITLENPAKPHVETINHASSVPMAGLRLLLVDDHEGVRATTAILLKDLGHQVTVAAGGTEVLAKLRADPTSFDCVVWDYAMPDISGAEVVRQARAIRQAMPALLITGYADAGSISALPRNVRVLTKPFTPEQLSGAIEAAIERSGSNQA